jgi:hypothetical protein
MNKEIKSLLIKTILTILVIFIANYFWQKNYSTLEKRYLVAEVIRIVPARGQDPRVEYNFIYLSKKYVKSNPRSIYQPRAGEFYVVEIPIKDINKSKILLNHPVPDTIKSPFEGWEEIPEFLSPK